jgi:Chalcone isomerase-like
MRIRSAILLALLLAACSPIAGAARMTLAGVTLPETVDVERNSLVLNGIGLRKKLFIEVYVGGLYLAARESSAAKSLVASNDNWKSTQQAAIEATGVPPTDDRRPRSSPPWPREGYTAIVLGAGGTTGVGLVEAYHLD